MAYHLFYLRHYHAIARALADATRAARSPDPPTASARREGVRLAALYLERALDADATPPAGGRSTFRRDLFRRLVAGYVVDVDALVSDAALAAELSGDDACEQHAAGQDAGQP